MLKYNEFKAKKDKIDDSLNEGIIGNALKSIKNKFALTISKKIGGAKKIDVIITDRKVEATDILKQKLKLEEELLLAKNAYNDSEGDENLKLQYNQKRIAVKGQMLAINKKEIASKKKFTVKINQAKKKGGELVSAYSELQEANIDMDLANIEIDAYKKMGRDSSKLEAKAKKQADTIELKKEEITKALQKKKEEGKEVEKIDSDKEYTYKNSKGAVLNVKILDSNPDKDGFIKVVNKEKEGKSDGFRVKAEDLKSVESKKKEKVEA